MPSLVSPLFVCYVLICSSVLYVLWRVLNQPFCVLAGVVLFRIRAPGAYKLGAWLACAVFFGWCEFGAVYLMVSAIVALFTIGVGKRKPGELSAYSVRGTREVGRILLVFLWWCW